jgi:hypothetical protein
MSPLSSTGYSDENTPIDHFHDVVCLEDSVHNGNVLSWDLVDRDVANLIPLVWRVDKEKDVPAMKRWLH